MRADMRTRVIVLSVALHLCVGTATAGQLRDPFALPIHGASSAPRHLSQAERARIIRRKLAERAVEEARQAARARQGGFHGIYPGWEVTLISRS